MANRKHLINVHTSTGTTAPTEASLYLGEIAVQHTPNEPAIWIKMGSADTSTEYEKFIGETKIINLLEETKTLGSGYTYSGLSYIDSSTTIADAFSALTNELIKDEKVTAAAINELNVKTNEINSVKKIIREDEEVTAGAINLLNERVAGVETHMTGDYIQITGYELASGSTEEELTLREEDTVDEAFGKLQKQMLDNEEAIAAGLNDLNNKVDDLEEQIEQSTGITQLSGAVRTLSAATATGFEQMQQYVDEELRNKASYTDLRALSAGTIHDIAAVSAKTAGILTLNLNGVKQGQYCPSASTVINLEAIQEITGADVRLTGYELATGSTEEELVVLASDTVNEAFGKLQKQNYDNEAVVAGALNDLDERVAALEEGGSVEPLSAATIALSAATVTLSSSTNADIQAISADTIELSAATVALSTASEDFFDGAEYVSSAKTIVFKNGDVEKASIDATDFIKDGMVSAVTISGGSMIISFNTDAGKEDIELELTDIFNPDNYYTKGDINDGVSASTLELSAATIEVESGLTILSGAVTDTNYVVALSLNDLNRRVDALSGNTGLNELSAATVNVKSGLEALSGGVTNLSSVVADNSDNIEELSAGTIVVKNDLATLSGVTEEIGDNLETLSGVVIDNELVTAEALINLNNKIDELSGDTGFDGFEEITWSALKTLRDSSGLTPGKQYRITDYNTTTSQEDTQAAGHQFDIIVVADAVDKLNENARVVLHNGDTYFANASARLESWEIKYSLDNDDKRFYWAVTGSTGRGVIYYMKDEWNNECPYDFKNIQFKRKISLSNGYPELDLTGGTDTWVFTFAATSYHITNDTWSGLKDGSLESPYGHESDENGSTFHDNVMGKYIKLYGVVDDDYSKCGIQYLNDNVFLGYWEEIGSDDPENTPYYYAHCAYGCTFGNNCYSNTFGNTCYSNTFGNDCIHNTFGSYCYFNTFGGSCYFNTFVNNCQFNTFGNTCYSNTFGNSCTSNAFGNDCGSNTFGNSCTSNAFGNDCGSNTFGNSCTSNAFGNDCDHNTFGNNCLSNTFGNNCYQIIFNKDNVRNVMIENGNRYITLTSTQSPTGFTPLRNITIAQGVNNGNSESSRKTISHNTLNDEFKTTYQSSNSQIINI